MEPEKPCLSGGTRSGETRPPPAGKSDKRRRSLVNRGIKNMGPVAPMLEGDFFNPVIQGAAPALTQIFGTLLFCSIFLFLWRQSGVVYFRFWSLAWAVESLALISSLAAHWSGSAVLLGLRALLEIAFAFSLLFAADRKSTRL